jgi:hypothetical protein
MVLNLGLKKTKYNLNFCHNANFRAKKFKIYLCLICTMEIQATVSILNGRYRELALLSYLGRRLRIHKVVITCSTFCQSQQERTLQLRK